MSRCLVFLTILFATAITALPEQLDQCKGTKAPLPTNAEGNYACDSSPCIIRNGSVIQSKVAFTIPRTSETLEYRINAYMGKVRIPMDFVGSERRNACRGLVSGQCPVQAGEMVVHSTEMPVKAPFLNTTIAMETSVVDSSEAAVFCYRLRVTVV